MLGNIVGTLLAFVTIMLMLSLIVTSLVQFTQATLRLRARNLLVGVAALLKKHSVNAKSAGGKTSILRSDPHLALAAHVLNRASASPKYIDQPNFTGRVLMGPPVSWVPSDDLARAVVSTLGTAAAPAVAAGAASVATGTQADVQETFEKMEPAIAKRFQFIIRLWTVAWSFVIAFSFQLSTPDLLKTLPSQEAKRQAILAAVPSLTSESTQKLAFSTDNVLEESIKRLTVKFPEYQELFEEVSGASDSKQDMMDEMRGVLGKRANRDAVLSEYSSIIDSLSQSAASTAYANTSKLIEQLDSFGVSPKFDNFDFYSSIEAVPAGIDGIRSWARVTHWTNIVGVLISGILLSLGAPFWFDQLKTLSSLRDTMNPGTAPAQQK